MAKLYVKFNTAVIREVLLDKPEITVGRRSDNDIVIDHPTVSGHHGRLRREENHFVVEDLGSTNGTFINGRRVKSGSIKDRDQIGIAGHILDFYDDDSVQIPLTVVEKEQEPPPLPPSPPRASAASETASVTAEGQTEAEVASDAIMPKDLGTTKIRIISGAVDGNVEFTLKERITYIGTKAPATIKIKGFLAPDLAAAISQRPEGYVLKAVKPGYPKVNGIPIQEQILLENGAAIEVGGTNMVFVKTH
jgi:pSer/pThr/pTyr-binding forkhead associated (FHA) protein